MLSFSNPEFSIFKKFIAGICVFFLLFGAEAATRIGIISVNNNSPSIYKMSQIALENCKIEGWECELYDGKGDMVATSNAAINFIQRKFDTILNIASDNNQLSKAIKQAKDAKIPFVSTFSGDVPNIVADIGADGVMDGAVTGRALTSLLGGKGHVIKLNWQVLPVLHERDLGFMAVMSMAPSIKVTEVEVKVPGQVEDTFNQVTNLLAANDDISAVWVGWDELATPAVRAIERAKKQDKVKVVGIDGIDEVLELLRQPNSPYAFTEAYSHRVAVERAVQVIKDTLDGKTVPFTALMIRTCLTTSANVPPEGEEIDFTKCSPFSAELQN